MTFKRGWSAFLCVHICLAAGALHADIGLPGVFSDNMVLQRDKPIQIWGWATPKEKIKVTFNRKSARTRADQAGNWRLELPAMAANAEPETLFVKGRNTIAVTNILVGEVWLCSGQSNMKWPMHATQNWGEETNDYPNIRLCKIPKSLLGAPTNNTSTSWTHATGNDKAGFSAVGYHFGKQIHETIGVPIGLIQSAVDGSSIATWIPLSGFDSEPSLKMFADDIRARTAGYQPHFWTPAGFYNGMIHPLTPLRMRGILWYQGEADVAEHRGHLYLDSMRALVESWRMEFEQDDLSCYFVQLAPHTYYAEHPYLPPDSLPHFWEIQFACMQTITNTGMAALTDVTDDMRDWHPRHKRSVGQRLARWALARNYGLTNTVVSGPVFKSMALDGNEAILHFDHLAEGLESRDGAALTAFTMAGPDEIFQPAAAVVSNDTIVVRSPYVDNPVAVRYAWHETTIGNLCNSEGLPAFPFRTDNFHPFICPAMNTPMQDTAVCMGPDGTAYLTGTTGLSEGVFTNAGIRVWSSTDLRGWQALDLVWSFATNATWQIASKDGRQAIRAPEIHYINDTFWLSYSMNYGGTGLLKSQSGNARGPYVDVKPDGPLTDGVDASLFQDVDGSVYFVTQNGMIARMQDDLSGLAEAPHLLKPANADAVGTHGAFIGRIEGRYTLMATELTTRPDGSEVSHCMAAQADALLGPYGERKVAIPHAGQTTLFRDKSGAWWSTFSGNDDEAAFRNQPAVMPLAIGTDGGITPLRKTMRYTPPLVIDQTLLPHAKQEVGTWRYTLTPPADDWFKADFDDSSWQEGQGGFGTPFTPNTRIGTLWDTGAIWMRRTFTVNAPIRGILHLQIHHDEEARVYLNGVHASEATWFNGDFQLYPVSAYAALTVRQGENTIAVYCNQQSGGQYIDVGLVTTRK